MRSTSSAWGLDESCAAPNASFNPCCGSVVRLASAVASSSRAWARLACDRAWLRCVSAKTATRRQRERDQARRDDREQTAMLAIGLLALALEPPLASSTPAPRRRARRGRSRSAAPPPFSPSTSRRIRSCPSVSSTARARPRRPWRTRRDRRRVRDLRPRRRDEMVEDARGDVLLLRAEPGERAVEVLADDRLGPAERRGTSEPEPAEPSSRSASQSRSSTSWRYGASMCASRTPPSTAPRMPSASSSRPVAPRRAPPRRAPARPRRARR